jgi:hypothetical protein
MRSCSGLVAILPSLQHNHDADLSIAAVRPLRLREPAITMKDDGPYFKARVNMPEVGSPILGLSLNLRREACPTTLGFGT